jgi:signal transduction histidine kinase
MSDAFFTLDPAWRFTYLNPQAEALMERSRGDLIGTCIWDEFPVAIGSRFDDESRRAIRDNATARFEQPFGTSGTIFEVRTCPVDEGVAVYFTDVTDERRREARLHQTERLEMLGELTAGIVHDFNNVLIVVESFANLGIADAPNDTMTLYFKNISSASKKAKAMADQLMAFASQQDLSPTTLDLNDVAVGMSSMLHQLMKPGVSLALELSPDPVWVFVDRSQLEQVVLNLVVNSRDAMSDTGVVTVSTTTQDPASSPHENVGPSGWLQVADTGGGIAADVLPHIFDPFFSTKPTGKGTGLGLATIYGIVTQSAGHIFVESEVGEGTTMTVALPKGQN